MNAEHREKILALIVEEAIQKDKDKGMIIDNPSGYYNYKLERARHQAKEDPNWLLKQKDRLMGSVQQPLGMRTCARCDALLQPMITFEYHGKDYCDLDCAEGVAVRMTFREWMEDLFRKGKKESFQLDAYGNRAGVIVVTWDEAKRLNPKLANEIERNANEF